MALARNRLAVFGSPSKMGRTTTTAEAMLLQPLMAMLWRMPCLMRSRTPSRARFRVSGRKKGRSHEPPVLSTETARVSRQVGYEGCVPTATRRLPRPSGPAAM